MLTIPTFKKQTDNKNGIKKASPVVSLTNTDTANTGYTGQTQFTKRKRKDYSRTRSAYPRVCTSVRQELRRVFKVKLDVCLLFLYTPHIALTFEYFY